MAAELGIGVRVRTGRAPDKLPNDTFLQFQTGTIIDGPVRVHPSQGRVFVFMRWMNIKHAATYWMVLLDTGNRIGADERYLFPLDDDNDQTTRDEREPVEEEA